MLRTDIARYFAASQFLQIAGRTIQSKKCQSIRRRSAQIGSIMNPLFTLWLLVLGSAVALSIVFYLAENYPHIVGNFYVLLGLFIGGYLLWSLVGWIARRGDGKSSSPSPD